MELKTFDDIINQLPKYDRPLRVVLAGSDGENMLQGTLKSLFAVAENYPDLKANTNFMDLQNQLKVVEEDIANARKFYNGVVKQFNIKCESFPSNLIANIFHFEKQPMFEVDAPEERQNVKVSFS